MPQTSWAQTITLVLFEIKMLKVKHSERSVLSSIFPSVEVRFLGNNQLLKGLCKVFKERPEFL